MTNGYLFIALPHIIYVCFTLPNTLLGGQGTYSLSRHDFHIPFFYTGIISFLLPSFTAMEDWNMLAADCVVISCCCQCLLLQLLIFILLKLPCKLFRKTKEYAKKKLRIRYRKKAAEKGMESVVSNRIGNKILEFHERGKRIQVEGFHESHGRGSCMKDIEGVLEELSQRGEFAFGSFWGREGSEGVDKQELDLSLVQFELVEIVSSSDNKINQLAI
ncbi:conserved hypothetical protein [Ricinus communis]|uniref:Uncharacterized protein n=1 Tax=Ricinus communis TaxID=3988 RepID=B9RLA2_RICCO|nr:conserved hypothetical protein [Ricinus communis]|eukprot:XP_002514521.3 uncharacterized protein LOC8264517 [Ricinus communis]